MENKQEQAEIRNGCYSCGPWSKPQALGGLALARIMRTSLYLSYKKNKEKKKGYCCGLAMIVNFCKLPAFVTVLSSMPPAHLLAFAVL